MTVPPNSNFSFSQFMSELCDVNVTVLTTESNEYNGGQIVMDAVRFSICNIVMTVLSILLDNLLHINVDLK